VERRTPPRSHRPQSQSPVEPGRRMRRPAARLGRGQQRQRRRRLATPPAWVFVGSHRRGRRVAVVRQGPGRPSHGSRAGPGPARPPSYLPVYLLCGLLHEYRYNASSAYRPVLSCQAASCTPGPGARCGTAWSKVGRVHYCHHGDCLS